MSRIPRPEREPIIENRWNQKFKIQWPLALQILLCPPPLLWAMHWVCHQNNELLDFELVAPTVFLQQFFVAVFRLVLVGFFVAAVCS